MGRTKTDKTKRTIFGARFSKQFHEWQREEKTNGKTRAQLSFGKLLDPPVDIRTVQKWCSGENIPSPQNISQICEIFGVPEDYFDTDNATHDEKYEYDSAFVTQIGQNHVKFAKEEGLNLHFVEVLSQLIDFDESFPLYSPICQWTHDPKTLRKVFDRDVTFMKSAPIDKDLEFLQVVKEGKRITMHERDLLFLKEVQDQVVDYMEYLFYKRQKEMKAEVQKFNDDLYIEPENPDDDLIIKPITADYICEHDRFAKPSDFTPIETRPATQEDIDRLFDEGMLQEISQKDGE